jgi:hypothetical protein
MQTLNALPVFGLIAGSGDVAISGTATVMSSFLVSIPWPTGCGAAKLAVLQMGRRAASSSDTSGNLVLRNPMLLMGVQ